MARMSSEQIEDAWDAIGRRLSDFRDAGGDPHDLAMVFREIVMAEVFNAHFIVMEAQRRAMGQANGR